MTAFLLFRACFGISTRPVASAVTFMRLKPTDRATWHEHVDVSRKAVVLQWQVIRSNCTCSMQRCADKPALNFLLHAVRKCVVCYGSVCLFTFCYPIILVLISHQKSCIILTSCDTTFQDVIKAFTIRLEMKVSGNFSSVRRSDKIWKIAIIRISLFRNEVNKYQKKFIAVNSI